MDKVRANGQGGSSIRFENWGYRHASRTHFAIQGLNLRVEAGQRVLLLGASGIGKSTILEAAAGLLGADDESADVPGNSSDASSDDVNDTDTNDNNVNDTDVNDADVAQVAAQDSEGGVSLGQILVNGVPARSARGKVGLVLQDPESQAIFERVGDNVAFGPENMTVPRDEIWGRVDAAMADTGLEGLQLHRSTMHLSGGQMQRLALAGALAMQPGVLLLDEPTANLDPDGVHQIVASVQSSLDATGATMVLVEHRVDPWIDMIDRVVVLGRRVDESLGSAQAEAQSVTDIGHGNDLRTCIVADGTPEEVFGHSGLDFTKLGIWVPKRYRRSRDEIHRIHVEGEPSDEPSHGSGETVLSTKDLAIGRNGNAIAEHIDIDFAAGQITAIVGQNGAGKSTLALTLAGLLEPVAGAVEAAPVLAAGTDETSPFAWSSTQLAARISYVFQNPEHQFARGSVLEEVMLGPVRTGVGEAEAKATAERLLHRFRLSQYANANPYTLSGGEKRRLTVASALAAAPRVVVLDEPTFGQDRITWMEIAELIQSLRADGVSIIVITHDRDLVTALGARVVELEADEELEISQGDAAKSNGTSGQEGHFVDSVGSDALEDAIVMGDTNVDAKAADAGRNRAQSGTARSNENKADDAKAVEVSRVSADTAVSEVDAWGKASQHVKVSQVNSRDEAAKASSRSRFMASLNPAYRMIGGFLAALPLIITLDWVSATVALALELLALICIGFKPWQVVKSTWPVFVGAPGSALAVLLYGKSGGAVWWQWGMIKVTDRSAMLALATGLRVLAIGIPAIIAVIGIDATDLADSFSQVLHLPDRFVYGGLAGMRMFSVLRDDWAALTASRRSRGLGDENKVKAFFPQAFALFVLSIRRSTTLATAMEARGFGGTSPRTHARVSAVHTRDRVFVAVCLLIPIIALAASVWAGTFVFFGG